MPLFAPVIRVTVMLLLRSCGTFLYRPVASHASGVLYRPVGEAGHVLYRAVEWTDEHDVAHGRTAQSLRRGGGPGPGRRRLLAARLRGRVDERPHECDGHQPAEPLRRV